MMPKSTDRTLEEFEAILTNPDASQEDNALARACIREYTDSVKYMTRGGEAADSPATLMFARFRMSCVESGITLQYPLPKDDEDGNA